jgi:CRP/FNR family transcriptional regulator
MISNPAHQQQLIESFDFLRQADPAFHHAFFEAATLVHVPQGHTIAEEGSECTQLALLVDGSVRVYKLAAKGREITLYRIKRGDSCVLTASCVMSHTPFPAIAEAETDLNAVVIPARFVRDWVSQSQAWSGFVFSLVSRRLADVITVLESVTFLRLDVRVAAHLLDKAGNADTLTITHHEIAADLGSSREVVSRTLKTFAKHGWIQMGRGELTILDRPHLQELAESEEL